MKISWIYTIVYVFQNKGIYMSRRLNIICLIFVRTYMQLKMHVILSCLDIIGKDQLSLVWYGTHPGWHPIATIKTKL